MKNASYLIEDRDELTKAAYAIHDDLYVFAAYTTVDARVVVHKGVSKDEIISLINRHPENAKCTKEQFLEVLHEAHDRILKIPYL